MLNKKAQIGDTLMWVIATVLIFVILLFFFFGSSVLGKTKSISSFRPSLFSKSSVMSHDVFLTKSLFTYLKARDSRQEVQLNKLLKIMEKNEEFSEPVQDRLVELQARWEGRS